MHGLELRPATSHNFPVQETHSTFVSTFHISVVQHLLLQLETMQFDLERHQ